MPQISLRQLFVLVTVIAAAIVSLHHASETCQALTGLAAMLAFSVGLAVAVFDRGPRQAFAIGFTLMLVVYAGVVMTGKRTNSRGTTSNPELSGSGQLPTTILLRQLHTAIEKEVWQDVNTGQELPNFDVAKELAAVAAGAPPTAASSRVPELGVFARTGHYWWAMLLAYLGGHFARFVYLRRMKEQSAAAKE